MCVSCFCVYTSNLLSALMLTTPTILIPGSVTGRYVILTLPRWTARSHISSLTTSICGHEGSLRCNTYFFLPDTLCAALRTSNSRSIACMHSDALRCFALFMVATINPTNKPTRVLFYWVPKIVVQKDDKCKKSNFHLQSGGAEFDNACGCGDRFVKGNLLFWYWFFPL